MLNKILVISDYQYQTAAQAIAAFRAKSGETNLDTLGIEKVLRAYAFLGEHKLISDWSYQLSDADRNSIVTAVCQKTDELYNFYPSEQKVYVDLQLAELLASQGLLDPSVAAPREWQTRYETDSLPTVKDQTGFLNNIQKGITDFFGFVKANIESMLKGLGFNIPLELIIGLAAVFVLMMVSQRPRYA